MRLGFHIAHSLWPLMRLILIQESRRLACKRTTTAAGSPCLQRLPLKFEKMTLPAQLRRSRV